MLSKEELERNYSGLSNEELLVIAGSKNDYTPLALSIAKNEIAKRNISEEEIKLISKKWEEIYNHEVKKNYVIELSFLEKNLFYFFWFIHFLVDGFRENYKDDGLMLKFRQAGYFKNMSMVFLFISTIAAVSFSMPSLEALWIAGFIITHFIDTGSKRKFSEGE